MLPSVSDIKPLKPSPLPPFPGFLAALGPGVVWMALAQGSGELIWWPYMIAKYGLGFLFLLIPACLLQFPLNYEIGRYTILTGESIWQGLVRLNKVFAFLLWILMTVSFLWFGAFASAGGTALAALTRFPPGLDDRGQSLFWGYASIFVFVIALVFSRVVYSLIERLMWAVAFMTVAGLVLACTHPQVTSRIPDFLAGLFAPQPLARPWDSGDATKLLTAITFAGLGGFWSLFYSYWLREKGAGMAKQMGRITGMMGKKEVILESGFTPQESPEAPKQLHQWLRFLAADSSVGIFGNIFTTLLTCLLAYAVLFPEGTLPKDWEIAVVQSKFFALKWGAMGRALFLCVAAAFLTDTWLSTTDAVARVHTDMVYQYFPGARKKDVRFWYFVFVVVLTVITCATMPLAQPGKLIQISAVIGFAGTVTFSAAILLLNHFYLPKLLPSFCRPSKRSLAGITISCLAYFCLAAVYLYLL